MDAFTRIDRTSRPLPSEFEETGMAFWRRLLNPEEADRIKQAVACSGEDIPKHGIRNAEKKFPTIAALTTSETLRQCVRQYLAGPPRLLRAIYFDKTPATNWYVTWHQDKTIAVRERFDAPGWGPWSVKDGVPHVQPPRELLERMVTLRIHLDPADESNGCLRVIPPSHRAGILQPSAIEEWVAKNVPLVCRAETGDTLVMRPLLLHASRRAMTPSHRRIVHLEYGDFPLP